MKIFDILVIGGSGGTLPNLIEEGYKKLNNMGRIIVTAILLETKTDAISTFKNLSIIPDVVDISITKGQITERGTMMLARNPITIITAVKDS